MANLNYTTYTTKRYPMVGNMDQRSGALALTDQTYVNFFASITKELDETKYYIEQRPGLAYVQGTVAGEGRGIYYWNSSTLYAVANVLYRDGTPLITLSTSTGVVGFQEFANATNQSFLIILDGTSGWVINQSFVPTKITDVDFPSPHVVHAGVLDGYLVVAKVGTGDLYNCNLEDPLNWTAGDFISAESYPDPVVSICRQNNYIVAVGSYTTEFFYDSGVYPGTPLARNSAALHQLGTPAPDTVVEVEEQVLFVSQTQTGGYSITLFNSFTPTDIATEAVRKSLDATGVSINKAKAFCVRTLGHRFYVLSLASLTWVYDFDTQMWHQWADYTGTSKFNCGLACDGPYGTPYLLDNTAGYVFKFREGVSQDDTSPTTFTTLTSIAITTKYDFGTMNRKFMSRFCLLGDMQTRSSAYSNPSYATVYWTDDDYRSWSSGKQVPITGYQNGITQLGSFRRRAFKIVYSGANTLRLEAFEVDINVGSQ